MLKQKVVDLVVGLAPVIVGGRILAVHQSYHRHFVFFHTPVVAHRHDITVFVADRLIVPGLLLLIQEDIKVLLTALEELVWLIDFESSRQLIRHELHIRVVQNVEGVA